MADLRLEPDAPDTRSRCPDCRGSGAVQLLDGDLPTSAEVTLADERWDYCPRCCGTGLATIPHCACGAISHAPGSPCMACASREERSP